VGQRLGNWQKYKTQQSDNFAIGGFISGRFHVDEIVVSQFRGKDLFYMDSTKNEFVPATRKLVLEQIQKLIISGCPFVNLPEKKSYHRMDTEKMQKVKWVKPTITYNGEFSRRHPGSYFVNGSSLGVRCCSRSVLSARITSIWFHSSHPILNGTGISPLSS